jgi:signal transduction histidine kinase
VPHDVFALVRAAVADFREDALASGFRIEMNLDPGLATVQSDEEALRRTIRNLLENAVKYSPECRTIWVDGAVNGHHATITVQDRGMGIDPCEQREIFQKFVRGAAAKKVGIKGTGIGLSMVHQIIDAMGGEIRLESAAGAGSTFTILLPLVRGC